MVVAVKASRPSVLVAYGQKSPSLVESVCRDPLRHGVAIFRFFFGFFLSARVCKTSEGGLDKGRGGSTQGSSSLDDAEGDELAGEQRRSEPVEQLQREEEQTQEAGRW